MILTAEILIAMFSLLVSVAGGVVAYGKLQGKVQELDNRISRAETQLERGQSRFRELEEDRELVKSALLQEIHKLDKEMAAMNANLKMIAENFNSLFEIFSKKIS